MSFTWSISSIMEQTLINVYYLQSLVANKALSKVKTVAWSVKWTVKASAWELLHPASNQTCPPWWVHERWKAVERGKIGIVPSLPPGVVLDKLIGRPTVMDKTGYNHLLLRLPHSGPPRLHREARLLRNSNRKEEARSTGFLIKIKVGKLWKLINNQTIYRLPLRATKLYPLKRWLSSSIHSWFVMSPRNNFSIFHSFCISLRQVT